jgi:crossover junction endodeoxyribonuclease RusA
VNLMKTFSIELPFPPSVNAYYRAISRGKFCQSIISEKGRKYKADVEMLFNSISGKIPEELPSSDRLTVDIALYPPDKRRRDLDNHLKALLDSCTGHIWEDDEQIDRLIMERKEAIKGGKIEMTVEVR